jgi:acyl-CoA synthetase
VSAGIFLTNHHPARAARFYEAGLWQADTFYSLLTRHAGQHPGRVAIRDGQRSLSWRELKQWVDGVANDLVHRGLVRGDRVSIWMSNRIEAVVLLLACAREGLACNPSLHKSNTVSEVFDLLNSIGAKALLHEDRWGAERQVLDFDAVSSAVPSLSVFFTGESFPQAMTAPAECGDRSDPDDVAYLAFTSGTTGRPKCVMHSQNTLLANARDLVRDWSHGPETVLLSLSPLSHHIAWVGVAQWLLAGCQFVTNDPPPGCSRLTWLVDVGATYVMGVPTHAMDILAEHDASGKERLGEVSVFYMAGSPIPPSVAARFVSLGIKPQNVYGMSENSSHQYTHPDDPVETITGSCGRGGKAYEVKIFDPEDQDREVAPGTIGQIGGRGAALMLGYYDNQVATESSFNRGGWFMSGDLGVIDAHGNLQIEGRLKDLIIRGGHNIHPSGIEFAALSMEGVVRAAAFGVPDSRLGERVCLAIEGEACADALLQHLGRQGVSKYDAPEYFLRVEQMPLTASGKVLKRELIALVRDGHLSPVPLGRGNDQTNAKGAADAAA